MIAAALRHTHEGRKLQVGSINGVIWSVQAKHRHKRVNLLDRQPIDMHIHIITGGTLRHIVLSPKTEVSLHYADVPNLYQ